MNGETGLGGSARAAVVVAVATLVALALPAVSPLYAQVYPGPDADTIDGALTEANLDTGFAPKQLTQFEKARFSATLIYGTAKDPALPTVKVAWSNKAGLAAQDEDAFVIVPITRSRQFLDEGSRRPGGGYELTWSWEVTPLVAGEQTLFLSIVPTVVVEGKTIPDLVDINDPIAVAVDVNPVKRDFDEVVMAAAAMESDLPEEMTVGEEYDVSAVMSMAGHADTVTADITLTPAQTSADVSIAETSAAPQTATNVALAGPAPGDRLVRRWRVIPDETGQVDLVFTANVAGRAAEQNLEQDVPILSSSRAVEPGASVWEILKKPILYITPFVALLAMLFGLWTAWSKRHTAVPAKESAGESAQSIAPPGDPSP